ncbi:MAG: fluoride efflux transporter CrcB [Chlorobi bacterium]|nr:fluoride efflux transporter CrcB [Chlorobiota bacterium]
MIKWWLVFLGGGLGSMARFAAGLWLNANPYFMPYGTFAVNVAGSFLIGLAGGLSVRYVLHHPLLLYFWMAGFLGGFTTFSSFSFETLNLIRQGQWVWAAAYVTATVTAGLFAAAAGYYAAKYAL